MEESLKPIWYAVYVRSRYEKKVYLELNEKGLTTFLPLLETVRMWSDRKKKVSEPLFRGYVFVCIDYHTEHVKVLETEGVVKFIGIGRRPSVISERDIDWLRRLVCEPDAIRRTVGSIPPGKRVRVLAGPFMDFEGVVVKEGRDRHLVVYFDSIMQGVEITIRPELLSVSSKGAAPARPEGDAPSEADIRHLARP
jgi:transcription antitermination factor NusG